MAEIDLQSGHTIEGAGQHQADELDAGIVMPTQSVSGQRRVDVGGKAGVIGLSCALWRRSRMQEDRNRSASAQRKIGSKWG
ncbi:hypothetical protein [Bosea sp. CRIB-10]|uniref:hypothetical protein n=1 Tax=Bosea sp. CRIB-10 TaxID=378404 RepID=UPI001FCDB4C8|nr:hypothetical protein [Bosea sp. CRIB-10]